LAAFRWWCGTRARRLSCGGVGESPTSCCRRCYRVSARAVVLSAGGQRARLQPQL